MSTYPGFIVTGSDTDVGKTLVSAVLMKALMGTYWKPVQSGALHDSDRTTIQRLTRLDDSHFLDEAYKLSEPLSPHQAAKIDGIRIDTNRLQLPTLNKLKHRPLIVEGAGGVLVPVTDTFLMADLFVQLQLPVLVVCRNRLGVINHMLMTIEVLKARSIPVMGFISSGGTGVDNNLDTIARLSGVPLIGKLPEMGQEDLAAIDRLCSRVDTSSVMRTIGL